MCDAATYFATSQLVLVSGKLYYDLVKERLQRKLDSSVAIVRLEELCPFPIEDIAATLAKYAHATEVVWCQEEPQNMGAYGFVEPRLRQMLRQGLNVGVEREFKLHMCACDF